MNKDLIKRLEIAVKGTIKLISVFFQNNAVYFAWFCFYFVLFSVLTRGFIIPIYIITVMLALSPFAEKLWRKVEGIRPLRLKSEKERLLPLFKEVYESAIEVDPNLSKSIQLYIKEDMTINAFAFGKSTLILTKGSIRLLSDECLKGLMAHELGHFAHNHTRALLISVVGNLPMTFIIIKLTDAKNYLDNLKIRPFILGSFVNIFYYIFRGVEFLGDLILMKTSRQNEYIADDFSFKIGFGRELTEVLIELYEVSISKPQSVKEQMRSTHPHITLRIEKLEKVI